MKKYFSVFLFLFLLIPPLAFGQTVTKEKIGEQDLNRYDGVTGTFTRHDSQGRTITLNSVGPYVDALITYGGGVRYTDATITAALSAIGTTNQVTLVLRPGVWVISQNKDWSSYQNVIFSVMPGTYLSHGSFTLNIPNPSAGSSQWLIGTGAVTFSGIVSQCFPEWFGLSTNNNEIAINAALGACTEVMLLSDSYRISAPITGVKDYTYLHGKSQSTTIIPVTDTFAAFDLNPVGHFTIENLTIDYGVATANTASSNAAAIAFKLASNASPYTYQFSLKNIFIQYPYRGFQDTSPAWHYSLENININFTGSYPVYIAPLTAKANINLKNVIAYSLNGGFYITNTNGLTMETCSSSAVTSGSPFLFSGCKGTLIGLDSEGNTVNATVSAVYNFSGSFLTVINPMSVSDVINASVGNTAAIFRNSGSGKVILQSPYTYAPTATGAGTSALVWGNTNSYTKLSAPLFDSLTGTGTKYDTYINVTKDPITHTSGEAVATSGTGAQDLQTYTIPAGSTTGDTSIFITAAGTKVGANGNKTITLNYGSESIAIFPAANNTNPWKLEAVVTNIVFTGTQHISWTFTDAGTVTQGNLDSSQDATAAIIVKLTGNCANASDQINHNIFVVEVK